MKLKIIMGNKFADIDFDDDLLNMFSATQSTTEVAAFIARETIPYYEGMLKMEEPTVKSETNESKELKFHMQRHLNIQTDDDMTFSELFEVERRYYLQHHHLQRGRRYDLADRFAEHMAATLDHLLEQKQ